MLGRIEIAEAIDDERHDSPRAGPMPRARARRRPR